MTLFCDVSKTNSDRFRLEEQNIFGNVKNPLKKKIISHDSLFNVLHAYFCHCPGFYSQFLLSQAGSFYSV